MIKYEQLEVFELKAENKLIRPEALPEVAHLDDPAASVMLDFTRVKPLTISQEASIVLAMEEMKTNNVHMLIVTNAMDQVIGIVDTEDLLGEKPIKILQENRIPRTAIQVKSVMTKRHDLLALNIHELKYARVGHVFTTLKNLRILYALVVESRDDGVDEIRGIFSMNQISKQLHIDMRI